MNRLALVDRGAGVAFRRFVALLFCVPSGEGNFFDSRPRLSSDLYDRYIALMELLMYTIEWLDVVLPLGNVATSLAKNAPSILMGVRLAAVRLRQTGCRSSRENPHERYSSKDHRLDCVPVSAMAVVVTWVLWAFSVIVAGLSTEMVMGTVGWSLSWACHHSPLVKM